MTPYLSQIAILTSVIALGACAGDRSSVLKSGAPNDREAVTVSVGPCFGFCPVYEVAIRSDGTIAFTGERHTAVLGDRTRHATREIYRSLITDLGRFRPADGETARIACAAAISDTSTYTITWSDAAGVKTTAVLASRCPSGPGHKLDAILGSLPQRLGIAAWTKQTTRPGASRG
jgi:hypothetical protein